ncbi:MAG: alpha/beta fold hydrolase [Wenzhouxiangella sp.]|jgi:pimeloyl-ACP methyl ester carboxylesterase|nr:alpha/beta fold hydrolase [Wenzhouxiangella sp.]
MTSSATVLVCVTLLAAVVLAFWFLWPTPLGRFFQWVERQRSGLTSRHHQQDSIQWHYLEGGRGEPLVLLHGFNANADHFCRVSALLGAHFRILAPDLPGFGETRFGSLDGFRIEDTAARVLSWLDSVGVHRFYLGGNSMGGYVAVAMARLAPDRVRGLWLLAPGGLHSAPLSPVLEEVAEDRHNPLVVRNTSDFRRLMDYCFVRPPWIPGPLIRLLARHAEEGTDLAQQIFNAMRFESAPLEEMAQGLDVPALVVWGQADQVLHPSGARLLEELMPRTRVLVLEKIGHLPMLEAPKTSAEAWLSFADAIARSADESVKPKPANA